MRLTTSRLYAVNHLRARNARTVTGIEPEHRRFPGNSTLRTVLPTTPVLGPCSAELSSSRSLRTPLPCCVLTRRSDGLFLDADADDGVWWRTGVEAVED